jgi:hypothetical protein
MSGDVLRCTEVPASFLQESRIRNEIALTRAGQPSVVMMLSTAVEVESTLADADIVEGVGRLVQRHQSLRTGVRFCATGERGQTFVAENPATHVEVLRSDASGDDERLAFLTRELTAMETSAVPLERPPLWRVKLIRFDHRTCVLLFAIDHFVIDGWSLSPLLDDLAALTAGQSDDSTREDVLDWIAWQRAKLAGQARTRLVDYWRTALGPEGVYPDHHFPMPDDDTNSARYVARPVLDRDDRQLLLSTSSARVSPFIAYIAAFAMAVQRAHGGRSVLIHTPTANRVDQRFDQVVGWLAHSLPIRLAPTDDIGGTLDDALVAVTEALEHQDLPLPELVRELQPEFRAGRWPGRLYFSLETFDDEPRPVPGGQLRQIELPSTDLATMPGLSCYCRRLPYGVQFELVIDPREVHPAFADLVAAHMATALSELAAYVRGQSRPTGR